MCVCGGGLLPDLFQSRFSPGPQRPAVQLQLMPAPPSRAFSCQRAPPHPHSTPPSLECLCDFPLLKERRCPGSGGAAPSRPVCRPQDILVASCLFLSAGCRKEPQSSRELTRTHRGCMMSHVEVGQLDLIVSLCRLGLAGVHYSGGAGKAGGHTRLLPPWWTRLQPVCSLLTHGVSFFLPCVLKWTLFLFLCLERVSQISDEAAASPLQVSSTSCFDRKLQFYSHFWVNM